MATKTLTLNFADANEADIVAALKASAATNGTPTPTKAQAWVWFEEQCKAHLRAVVRGHRQAEAAKQAEAASAVDIT